MARTKEELKEYNRMRNAETKDKLHGETFKCKGCGNYYYLAVAKPLNGLCWKCR